MTCNRSPTAAPSSGLRVVRVDGIPQCRGWSTCGSGAAGFVTLGPRPALVAGRVQHQTRAVQRDPIVELNFPHPAVVRGALGVQVPVPG